MGVGFHGNITRGSVTTTNSWPTGPSGPNVPTGTSSTPYTVNEKPRYVFVGGDFPTGSNTTTSTATIPSNVVAGDLLIAVWNVTATAPNGPTAPTGWTYVGTSNPDGTSNLAAWIYTKIAVGGDAGATVSQTSGITRQTLGVLAYRDSLGGTMSVESFQASASTGTTPSDTTTADNAFSVTGAVERSSTGGIETWTVPGSVAKRAEQLTDNGTGGKSAVYTDNLGYHPTGYELGSLTFTPSASSSINSWVLVVKSSFSNAYTGDAAVTVTSAITADGVVDHSTGATETVTASITAAGVVDHSTGATETVTTIIAGAGVRAAFGDAPEAITASITAAGSYGAKTGATETVTASITADGVVAHSTGATETVTASITAVGVKGLITGSSEAVTASLTGALQGGYVTGAPQTITDSITADGVRTASTGATETVTASITATGVVGSAAPEALTATITANGVRATSTGATQVITASITADGVVAHSTGATETVTASITGALKGGFVSGAPEAVTASITAAGVVGKVTSATVTTTASLTSAGIHGVNTVGDQVDSFNSSPGAWINRSGNFGSQIVMDGQLHLQATPNYSIIDRNGGSDFTTGSISAALLTVTNVGAASGQTDLQLFKDANNFASILVAYGNTLFCREYVSGYSDTQMTYDPQAMRYMRLRTDSSTIYWETSPDRITWTVQRSKTAGFSLSSVTIRMSAGNWTGVSPDQGTAVWDELVINNSTYGLGRATTATRTATGVKGLISSGNEAITASITASGQVTKFADTTETVSTAITATGLVARTGSADLAITVTHVADGTAVAYRDVAWQITEAEGYDLKCIGNSRHQLQDQDAMGYGVGYVLLDADVEAEAPEGNTLQFERVGL